MTRDLRTLPAEPQITYPADIKDKTVLLTGAAGGMGQTLCRHFLAAGATVTAIDVARPTAELRHKLAGATYHQLDLQDAVRLESFVLEQWTAQPIDILVNGAGICRTASAAQTSVSDWDELFAVNARAVFVLSSIVGELMAKRGGGSIITIASNSAVLPRASMVAYGASKAAASLATRSLGLELGPRGVRCNVVCPGTTRTPMIEGMGSETQFVEGFPDSFKAGIPLGRIADPSDTVGAVMFLSSDAARHITCQELVIDGGASGQ